MTNKVDWDRLLEVRAAANRLDDCLNEFGDDAASACGECAQDLHDALYESRHIEPKLLGFFTNEEKPVKFRNKPVVIEAYRWFEASPYVEGQKRDVDYFRHPDMPGEWECKVCSRILHDHGFIDSPDGGHKVCPGDWIITGVTGGKYPCKPEVFEATYELAEDLSNG